MVNERHKDFWMNIHYDLILTRLKRLPRGVPFPSKLLIHSQGAAERKRTGGPGEWHEWGTQEAKKSCFFTKRFFQSKEVGGGPPPIPNTRSPQGLINALHTWPGCMVFFKIPMGTWDANSVVCHELTTVFTTDLEPKEHPRYNLWMTLWGPSHQEWSSFGDENQVERFGGNSETFAIDTLRELIFMLLSSTSCWKITKYSKGMNNN